MHNINVVLQVISQYFDPSITVDQIEEIIENTKKERENDEEPEHLQSVEDLLIVKTARIQPDVLNQLVELCSECRSALDVEATLSSAFDSWEHFSTFIVPEQLLAYFSCLIELSKINPINSIDRRLSLISGRSYLLMQTIPGAKAFGIFHPALINRTFNLFQLLNVLITSNKLRKEHERIDLLINFISLMEDIELLLKYVSLEEHLDLKKSLINSMGIVLQHYYSKQCSNKCKFIM